MFYWFSSLSSMGSLYLGCSVSNLVGVCMYFGVILNLNWCSIMVSVVLVFSIVKFCLMYDCGLVEKVSIVFGCFVVLFMLFWNWFGLNLLVFVFYIFLFWCMIVIGIMVVVFLGIFMLLSFVFVFVFFVIMIIVL